MLCSNRFSSQKLSIERFDTPVSRVATRSSGIGTLARVGQAHSLEWDRHTRPIEGSPLARVKQALSLGECSVPRAGKGSFLEWGRIRSVEARKGKTAYGQLSLPSPKKRLHKWQFIPKLKIAVC